ncbi:hypothetical protein WCE55_02160 [Luteimonas sp. MJ293]|uniref:hypothetical protein n=1 Tax=Luteimonas sp. MJ146 TaxID=3129240 RepID=UPI0031BAE519
MGLIGHIRHRADVWSWRVRYWYLDTPAGARARVGGFVAACMVLVLQMVRMAVSGLLPALQPQAPAQAVYWWVWQLVILIVSAAISYALRPKAQQPQEQKHDPPTVEDGTAAKDYFGTCWIDHDDNFLLAWQMVGRDPIRTKAGKK